jgi:hypothetical protein|tara:strand:- start:2593 stop:2901 length:309 start_codon:yes stop_codon:yes gene_type:complete
LEAILIDYSQPLRKLKNLRLHSSQADDYPPSTFGHLSKYGFSTPSVPLKSTSGEKPLALSSPYPQKNWLFLFFFNLSTTKYDQINRFTVSIWSGLVLYDFER